MKRLSMAACGCLLLFLAQPCWANNTYFLPGDAFFYFRVDKSNLDGIGNSKSPVFTYGNHWDGGFFCGYVGFKTLQIAVPPSVKNALGKIYDRIEGQLEKDGAKQTKMSVFVYNADYDWQKYGIAIQYNENWVDESLRFFYRTNRSLEDNAVRLEDFVRVSRAVQRAWRDSKRVPALAMKLPEIPRYFSGAWDKTPAVLDRAFQLIVIPNRNFADYYKMDKDGLELFVVTNKKVESYRSESGEWKRQ